MALVLAVNDRHDNRTDHFSNNYYFFCVRAIFEDSQFLLFLKNKV